MDKFHEQVLRQFAAMGVASSRFEVFGRVVALNIAAAMWVLCTDGFLAAVDSRDQHGGTRYEVTDAGKRAMGETDPAPLSRLRVPGKVKRVK